MIGQTVSHYKIVEELGGGGMGVVYKAEDTKLKRIVALKFLPPELTRDEDSKARFIHEAQAASALQHHNICTIHEIDETKDGKLFICMDCYEGETLKQRVAKAPRPVGESLDIVLQIAEGLSNAHEADVVHRDIKPANVMVTRDGVVKIVDFGLAKLAGQTRVTKTGTTVGTVAYMSSEQAQGKDIDGRTDIWSMGVLLYELLTGQLPFRGDHEAAVVYSIINTDPEPLASHRTDLPGEMQGIIDKCLAKEIDQRYQSASELKRDLKDLRDSISTGRSALTGGTSRSQSTKSASRRWGVIAIVALLIVVGIVAVTTRLRGPQGPPLDEASLAIVDFRDLVAPDDPLTSAEITALLHVGLVESSPIRVVSPDYLHDLRRRSFGSARGPIGEDQVLEVARQSGATHLLSGQVKKGQYVMWRLVDTESGQSLAAERADGTELVELADRVIAAVIPVLATEAGAAIIEPTPSVTTITTDSREAYSHYVAGVLAREEHVLRVAIREFEAAVALDSTFALAYFGLSDAQYWSHQIERGPARRFADLAWRHRARLGIKDRLRLEAWRERLSDQISEAIVLYQQMLERWPDDRQILADLSGMLFFHHHLEDAVSVTRQAIRLYPDDPAFTAYYVNSLGPLGYLREALQVCKAWAEGHPSEADVWTEVGQRYYELALPDSAEIAFRRALDIDSTSWHAERYISYCYYCRGDIERAIEIQEQLLSRDYLQPGDRIWLLTRTGYRPDLPMLYAETGRFEKALACFERARPLVTTTEGEIRVGARRSRILLRIDRAQKVLEWARRAYERADTRMARYVAKSDEARALVALGSLEAARSAMTELRPLATGGQLNEVFHVRAEIELAENNPEAVLETLREWNRHGRYRVGGLEDIEFREMTARAHRMAGRLDEAASVHEEMLRVYRGHFLSHYDLGLIYQEMGRTGDAKREYATFLDAWAEADEGLPQVLDARRRLDEL